jgi:hypothetical protein
VGAPGARTRLTLVWRLRRAINRDIEVAQVVVVGRRRDALDGLLDEPLALLDDALR